MHEDKFLAVLEHVSAIVFPPMGIISLLIDSKNFAGLHRLQEQARPPWMYLAVGRDDRNNHALWVVHGDEDDYSTFENSEMHIAAVTVVDDDHIVLRPTTYAPRAVLVVGDVGMVLGVRNLSCRRPPGGTLVTLPDGADKGYVTVYDNDTGTGYVFKISGSGVVIFASVTTSPAE